MKKTPMRTRTPLTHPEKFQAVILSRKETDNLFREIAATNFIKRYGIKALSEASYDPETKEFLVRHEQT